MVEGNNIGNTIRQLRKKHGLSAKRLCEGLCSSSKLSKIESGDEYPKEELLQALMERMGELPMIRCLPTAELDYEHIKARKEISERLNHNDFDISKQLNLLANYESKMTNLEKQEYIYYQSIYLLRKEGLPDEALKKGKIAIRITFPDFSMGCDFSNHLFIIQEICIIHHIAIILAFNGDIIEAIKLLSQLEEYHYSHFMNHKIYACYYVNIVNNLAGWIGMQGDFKGSLKLSQQGLDYCKLYNDLTLFPNLLYTHGYTLCRLGKIGDGKKTIKLSLTIFLSIGNKYIVPKIEQDIKDSFGNQFWEELVATIF